MVEDESRPENEQSGDLDQRREPESRKRAPSQRGSNLVDEDRRRGGKKSAQSQERNQRGRFAGTKVRKEQGDNPDGDQGIIL